MPYKDKSKAKDASKLRMRKKRNVTPTDVTPVNVTPGVTPMTINEFNKPWFPNGKPDDVPGEAWQLLKPWTIKQIRDLIPMRESMGIDESQRWPRAISYNKWYTTRCA